MHFSAQNARAAHIQHSTYVSSVSRAWASKSKPRGRGLQEDPNEERRRNLADGLVQLGESWKVRAHMIATVQVRTSPFDTQH